MNARSFYRDYLLTCQPTREPDGRFQAHVVISLLANDRTSSQRFFDLEVFAEEAVAVEHARRSGMDWIDTHHRER